MELSENSIKTTNPLILQDGVYEEAVNRGIIL